MTEVHGPQNQHTHCPVCGTKIIISTDTEDAECPNCTYQFRTPWGRVKDAVETRRLEAENGKLKEWIRHAIRVECWGLEVDGGSAQDKAIELGLLVAHVIAPEEEEDYADSDFGPGDIIYLFSDMLED